MGTYFTFVSYTMTDQKAGCSVTNGREYAWCYFMREQCSCMAEIHLVISLVYACVYVASPAEKSCC